MTQHTPCTSIDEIDNVRWYSNVVLFTAYLIIMIIAKFIGLFDYGTASFMMTFDLIGFFVCLAEVSFSTHRIKRRAKALLWKPLGDQQIELGYILWHCIVLVAPHAEASDEQA